MKLPYNKSVTVRKDKKKGSLSLIHSILLFVLFFFICILHTNGWVSFNENSCTWNIFWLILSNVWITLCSFVKIVERLAKDKQMSINSLPVINSWF